MAGWPACRDALFPAWVGVLCLKLAGLVHAYVDGALRAVGGHWGTCLGVFSDCIATICAIPTHVLSDLCNLPKSWIHAVYIDHLSAMLAH